VGIVNGDKAEVTSGLNPGDKLIVMGQGEVQDGDPISLAKPRSNGAGAPGAGAPSPGTAGP
jgi:multidrug efflux pump subunit AcrA (membrane-fusion protein)